MNEPLLEINGLKKYYPKKDGFFQGKKSWIKAVDGMDLTIGKGETLGLVGESGCGKSTTGRMIVGLEDPTEGTVSFQGNNLSQVDKRELGKQMQMIFQDPFSSLNPRMKVSDVIAEPLRLHKVGSRIEQQKRVDELLERVGLRSEHGRRFPAEFSGGQRQRIGIARAIALSPSLIVCDEPVSALDVSIQAQVLNLLKDLQKELGVSYLFIAHGIQAVKYISDRIAVMYLGKIVEVATKEELFSRPQHPYTESLLSAVPRPDPKLRGRDRIILKGDLPSPENPPSGCRFHTRCPKVMDVCKQVEPALQVTREGTYAACHLVSEAEMKQPQEA
ncbi:hypothetical protein DH09_13780 [Bacillaceae bacterium JMAK1]|nr:hypothetical protein DH09_13780 [Bacillaceae bacterium JMAK1]